MFELHLQTKCKKQNCNKNASLLSLSLCSDSMFSPYLNRPTCAHSKAKACEKVNSDQQYAIISV
jgi:hypothetical protein